MSETATISIIIPYYNVESNLFDKCFESICLQTYSDFEVIIIDDGSEPQFATYLTNTIKQDTRFRVIRQGHTGVSGARNAALKISCGQFIVFIDADDYIAPWMLFDLWNAHNVSGADTVAAYYSLSQDDSLEFKKTSGAPKKRSSEQMKIATLVGMNCPPSNNGYLSAGPVAVLFNAQIARNIHFMPSIKYMEDVIWNYQYYEKCASVVVLDECVYAYRYNSESATHTYTLQTIEDREKSLLALQQVIDGYEEWFALRTFASYCLCCKCVSFTKELGSLRARIAEARRMEKSSVWNIFKKRGISKQWHAKAKIKRYLAITHLLPIVYFVKPKKY